MGKHSSESVIEVLLGEERGSLSESPSSSVERRAVTLLVACIVLLVSLALSLSFEFFTSDSIERLESASHVSSSHWSAPWLL